MIPAHIEHVFKALDRIERREPQQPMLVCSPLVEGSSTTAGSGTAGAGSSYPVTCRARYYEAASTILEDELRLHTHDNANELGGIIEAWLAKKRDNWEPRT